MFHEGTAHFASYRFVDPDRACEWTVMSDAKAEHVALFRAELTLEGKHGWNVGPIVQVRNEYQVLVKDANDAIDYIERFVSDDKL